MIRTTFALLVAMPCAAAQSFQFPDFSNSAGLAFNGPAATVGNNLRVSAAASGSTGSVFYDTPVSVAGGFDTTFDFEFTSPSGGGADGMTFVIHNDARGTAFLGNTGSALGYSGYTTSPAGTGLTNALVIEFDTWSSGNDGGIATNDASGNEISIHTAGPGEVHHSEGMSLGQIDTVNVLGISIDDTNTHTARIVYVPGLLQVFLDGNLAVSAPYDIITGGTWVNPDFGGTPNHAAGASVGGLNLMSGAAWVGFTAACGGAWENHDVLNWSFDSGSSAFGVCNGDGGDQIGCTPCPCGNELALGTIGGCLNSTGVGAAILRSGSSSVSASNLRFDAMDTPPTRSCYLFSGNVIAPANSANPCFGADSGIQSNAYDGLRCVVQGIQRHGVRQSDIAGGVGSSNPGWGAPDPFVNYSAFVAGSTRMFQMVYTEDPLSGCLTGRNTTQAVPVTMMP